MIALIFTAVVAVAAVVALAVVALRSQLAAGPSLAGRTIVVHTKKPDDQSVRGVLFAHHADRLVLREVVYLHAESATPLQGLVSFPMESVSFWQEVAPDAPLVTRPASRSRGRKAHDAAVAIATGGSVA